MYANKSFVPSTCFRDFVLQINWSITDNIKQIKKRMKSPAKHNVIGQNLRETKVCLARDVLQKKAQTV